MVARVALLDFFPPAPDPSGLTPLPLTDPGCPGLHRRPADHPGRPAPPGCHGQRLPAGLRQDRTFPGSDLVQALAAGHAPLISWIGIRAGSLGESSALLLLAGGLFLLATGVIRWQIPLAVFAGLAIPAAIGHALDPAHYLGVIPHVLSGAAVLGAFFIATDYVTSPTTAPGQLIFGVGVGLLTWVIRTYGSYPEGMAFAVLLMNALTPIIDRYTKPRILGRTRAGKPLDIPAKKGA